jgi:inner membrane protein
MLARSHVIMGVALGGVLAVAQGQPPDAQTLGLVALGALLPDIDHPGSAVGRRLAVISVPVAAIFGHRGFTHSLLALAGCIAALVAGGWGHDWAQPLAIGYISHLLADMLTPSGVPLLWPWRRVFTFPVTVKTGSLGEYIIAGAVAAACVAFMGQEPSLAMAPLRQLQEWAPMLRKLDVGAAIARIF